MRCCCGSAGACDFAISERLGFRDPRKLWAKILTDDLLSGTSLNGKLIALVARLPRPVGSGFFPFCLAGGVMYVDELLSDVASR